MPDLSNEGSVIMVGAGLSGLAAARHFISFGFKVVVLQARNRPEGRVYTQKMVLSCQQALDMQQMVGTDADRLSYAISKLGLKLMGPDALVNSNSSLVLKIANARKGRGRKHILAAYTLK